MPGKYGASDVTVTYDDGPGGTPRVITNFIMELGGVRIKVHQQTSHAFGDAWDEHTPTGHRSSPPIPMSGQWDTTATTGPHAVLRPVDGDASPQAATRTLVIVFGDGKTFTVETRLTEYGVNAKRAELTEFDAIVQPTGAAVWS